MRLRGRHLVHGLVLLQQLGVESAAQVRRIDLVEVVAGEEAVEVGIAAVRNVQRVRRKVAVAALGPEVRRAVVRQALAGLQEALIQCGLLWKLLGLRGGEELVVVKGR